METSPSARDGDVARGWRSVRDALRRPACSCELPVDLDAGFRLGHQVRESAVRHGRIFAQIAAPYAGAGSKRSFSMRSGTRVGYSRVKHARQTESSGSPVASCIPSRER